jgi:hypothetical protein
MSALQLEYPYVNPHAVSKRRGWRLQVNQDLGQKGSFEPLPYEPPLVYRASKLTHTGVIGYRVFENCNKKVHRNSIANLLSSTLHGSDTLNWLISQYKACLVDYERDLINGQARSMLDQENFDRYLTFTRQHRLIAPNQSRKIRSLCQKLTYYSPTRVFSSKRSGKYKMKVAFITLTAPETAETSQILEAFKIFMDYLQRTANCNYVWKKELGEKSHMLHFHVLINNFIPYYLISWKWKRALISSGVAWPSGVNGVDSTSHYRIEMPRSKEQVAHYISKYLSKVYEMPGEYGYLYGHSSILSKLKEKTIYEGDIEEKEIPLLMAKSKVITKDHVTIICADLLNLDSNLPKLAALFEAQYKEFTELIGLPQKFHFVEQSMNKRK